MNPKTSKGRASGTAGVAEFPDVATVAAKDRERESAERRKREEREARLPSGPEWVDTPTSQKVFGVLGSAQECGDIAVIHGGVGVGKTFAARRYASRAEDAWIATMTPAANRLRPCLGRVAEACGLSGSYLPVAAYEVADSIARRMSETRGLLIVDEAQLLGYDQLEQLRSLHDQSDCGLALLGNDDFGHRVFHAPKFAALASRACWRRHLPGVTKEDAEAMLDAWGVRGKAARAKGRLAAAPPGGLRRLARLLRRGIIASGKGAASGHRRRSLPGGAA